VANARIERELARMRDESAILPAADNDDGAEIGADLEPVEPEEAEAEAGEADGAGGGGDAVDADDAGFDHVASTRIQAVARGRRARREVAAMRAARAEAAVDAAMAAAEAASAAASTTAAAVPNKSFFPDSRCVHL